MVFKPAHALFSLGRAEIFNWVRKPIVNCKFLSQIVFFLGLNSIIGNIPYTVHTIFRSKWTICIDYTHFCPKILHWYIFGIV